MKRLLFCVLLATSLVGNSLGEEKGLFLHQVVAEGTAGALEVLDTNNQTLFLSPEAVITPEDVVSAQSKGTETVILQFTFRESAQERLRKLTSSLIGERFAVMIDGTLIMAPVVRDPFHESIHITGDFTREWADSLVERIQLRSRD